MKKRQTDRVLEDQHGGEFLGFLFSSYVLEWGLGAGEISSPEILMDTDKRL